MRNINGLIGKLKELEDFDVEIKTPFQKCSDCDKIKSDVELVIAPYAAEIHDEHNWEFLCDNCRHQQCQDV